LRGSRPRPRRDARGRGEHRVGGLGVTLTEVDAAAFDAQRLVADGAIARLTRAGVLDIAPDDLGLFRRNAELRAQVDLRTVAVFVVPEP
jgi:hypothetical protein